MCAKGYLRRVSRHRLGRSISDSPRFRWDYLRRLSVALGDATYDGSHLLYLVRAFLVRLAFMVGGVSARCRTDSCRCSSRCLCISVVPSRACSDVYQVDIRVWPQYPLCPEETREVAPLEHVGPQWQGGAELQRTKMPQTKMLQTAVGVALALGSSSLGPAH